MILCTIANFDQEVDDIDVPVSRLLKFPFRGYKMPKSENGDFLSNLTRKAILIYYSALNGFKVSVKLESFICLTENAYIFTDKCIVADNERLSGPTRDIIDWDFATSHNTKGLTYVADAFARWRQFELTVVAIIISHANKVAVMFLAHNDNNLKKLSCFNMPIIM